MGAREMYLTVVHKNTGMQQANEPSQHLPPSAKRVT